MGDRGGISNDQSTPTGIFERLAEHGVDLDDGLIAEATGAIRATVRGERRIEPLEMIGSEVAD